jgi:hypothetical protein
MASQTRSFRISFSASCEEHSAFAVGAQIEYEFVSFTVFLDSKHIERYARVA